MHTPHGTRTCGHAGVLQQCHRGHARVARRHQAQRHAAVNHDHLSPLRPAAAAAGGVGGCTIAAAAAAAALGGEGTVQGCCESRLPTHIAQLQQRLQPGVRGGRAVFGRSKYGPCMTQQDPCTCTDSSLRSATEQVKAAMPCTGPYLRPEAGQQRHQLQRQRERRLLLNCLQDLPGGARPAAARQWWCRAGGGLGRRSRFGRC